jgi:hypothetical protein
MYPIQQKKVQKIMATFQIAPSTNSVDTIKESIHKGMKKRAGV